MSNDNGGPAFPKAALDPWGKTSVFSTGMTMRDYFAAKAMQGKLAAPYNPASDQFMIARDSYVIADAMLKERAK